MTARTTTTPAEPNCRRAFQQMARQCLASVRQHREAAGRGDPDAVHSIRIALTKLRAARKFFAIMTRDTAWPKLKAEIQWLNRVLGAARDNDVTSAYARAARENRLADADSKQLARETSRTHRQLATALRSARCNRLFTDLARWIDKGPWLTLSATAARARHTQLLADFAPARLQRWKQRLARKAARRLGNGERRHRLRIAAKRYRYMREAITAMGVPEQRPERRDREAAQSVQHALGEIRDLNRLRKLQPERLSTKSYRRKKRRLLDRAHRAFRDLA